MQDSRNDKIIRDGKNIVLQRLFEGGFQISPRKGAVKITSHMLQQVFWKTIQRMKLLDFTLHGTGQDEWKEKLVSDAVAMVMKKGQYNASMYSKDGLFQKSLMWGDGWMLMGKNPKENAEVPILFNPISNSNCYFDSYSTIMRGAWGRGVSKCVVIFSYSWAKACQLYPKMKENGSPGQIPRDLSMLKELERTYTQTAELQGSEITEIAYFYDLDSETYAVFGGPGMTELEMHEGEDYPFELDGEKYIPVLNQMCMPSSAGIYNHGIFDMVYDFAVMTAELMNMAVGHAEDNVYPITIVNIPQAQASKFFNKVRTAHEMRAAGKKGYIAQEFGSSGSNSAVASQLTTQSLWQEWESLYNTFTREVARLGIQLDEIDRGTGVTATQIMAEEESSTALIKQIQEYNAPEAEFAILATIDMIKKFVKKSNRTPLELTTNYRVDGMEIKGNAFTLGDIADELRKNEYFVKVNSRSGANPSNVMQQAQIGRVLQMLQPGTPGWIRAARRFATLNDQELSDEDLTGGQSPQNPESMEVQPPSETDRLMPNAKSQPIMAA
jgi:hypothetical protein